MRTFKKSEAGRLLGINPRTIQFYTEEGLISPDIANPGRGRPRKYSRKNLFEILLIRELSRHGLTLEKIKLPYLAIHSGLMNAVWDVEKDLPKKDSVHIIWENPTEDTPQISWEIGQDTISVDLEKCKSVLIIGISNLIDELPFV